MGIVAFDHKSVRGMAEALEPLPAEPANCSLIPGHCWRDDLRLAVRDPAQLVTTLELPAVLIELAKRAARGFPLFAPWPYIARMTKGDPTDPLLRQVLPLADELTDEPGFSADAVDDSAALLTAGLLQKY